MGAGSPRTHRPPADARADEPDVQEELPDIWVATAATRSLSGCTWARMTSCTTSTSCRTPSQTHPRSTPPPQPHVPDASPTWTQTRGTPTLEDFKGSQDGERVRWRQLMRTWKATRRPRPRIRRPRGAQAVGGGSHMHAIGLLSSFLHAGNGGPHLGGHEAVSGRCHWTWAAAVVAERQSVASSDSGRENQQGGPAEDHGNHFSRAQGAGPASGAGHAVATDAAFK